ncbi:hypothetical protein LTR37_012000 [Vermiconidia calcicola]|uniref:Uncharacterized protein n=1 Tax=Vermiconidia calcicola TaxID=1690605 RepID=A0ACC3N3D1_9PEZI|nr:hypothetical protein LTR37_012000 [Vermiconidia calcicola]
MAKRKRTEQTSTSRKRVKAAGSPHPHGEYDPESEYKIKSIIGENKTHYHISWEDDEITGEQYENTWEPKKFANQLAIDDWKAQKAGRRELEQQSGNRAGGSRTERPSQTPQSPTPKKPAIPTRKKGRPRKIIESSSPVVAEQPNASPIQRVEQPAGDVLEIGESQNTNPRSQAEPVALDPAPDSPLFVPADSREVSEPPEEPSLPDPSLVGVHIPQPPSSFLAGEYEVVNSSEGTPISSALPARKSPEPSQYIPDPNDTSAVTEETTEVTLAPTTPSQQTRSVPVNLGRSSTKIVPDSQTILGSSSYVPSATVTTSSSAPEARQRTPPNPEQSTEHEDQGLKRPGEEDLHGPQADTQVSDPQSEAVSHAQSGQATAAGVSDIQQQPESSRPVPPSVQAAALETVNDVEETREEPKQEPNQESQQQTNSPRHLIERAQDEFESQLSDSGPEVEARSFIHEEPQQSPDQSATGATPAISTSKSAQPEQSVQSESSQHPSVTAESSSKSLELQPTSAQADRRSPDRQEEPSDTNGAGTTRLDAHSPHHNHDLDPPKQPEHSPSRGEELTTKGESIEARAPPTPIQASSEPGSQEGAPPPLTNHVDLTATSRNHSSLDSPFTVTPPPRRTIDLTSRAAGRQPPGSSAWLPSSFPFQTQLSRPVSAGTTSRNSTDRRGAPQSRPETDRHTQLPQLSTTTPRASSVPVGVSSPLSPLIGPPSHSIALGLSGSNIPPPPYFSSPNQPLTPRRAMDGTQATPKSGGTLSAKIQAMRERRRAEFRSSAPTSTPSVEVPDKAQPQPSVANPAAQVMTSAIQSHLASPMLLPQDGARSPSAVPADEPLPVITQEDMNSVARYETLLPQPQDADTSDRQRIGSLTTAITPPKQLGQDEDPETASLYTIPISLAGHQRDQYALMVYYYRDMIPRFLAAASPDTALVEEAKHFVERVRRVAMHPDLDNDETLTQYDVEPSQQASWDVSCSTKFRFLKELFECLRGSNIHIVVASSPGRIVDMLENFFRGIGVQYDRPTEISQSSIYSGSFKITLLATDIEEVSSGHADLVIAMDNLVRHDTAPVRDFRNHHDQGWAPMITLVVPKTIEHVERTISPTLPDLARARALVNGVYQLKTDAGKLEEGQLAPQEAAIALGQYLTSADNEAEWPLVSLGQLHDLESQTESDIEQTIGNVSGVETIHGEKRSREPDDMIVDTTGISKRARIEPPTNTAQGADFTHISDSVDQTTQSHTAGAELESSSPTLNAIEKRLQELLLETQDRLEEHIRDLSDLQYRHEKQRAKLVEITNERDAAIATAQQAVARLTEQSNNTSALRARRTELELEIVEANRKLLDHTVPERAQFEALRLEKAQALADKEKLMLKLEQANKDLEYVRGLYQNSSNSAQQLASQNSAMENQLAVAQNRATGEQAKLRQMGYDAFTTNLRDENKKMKTMLKDGEAAIKFRDEEIAKLKEASRGRMGTRGTSVPRSPRIGSPTKMMDGRAGSRQTSPVAVEIKPRNSLLHPLRNV